MSSPDWFSFRKSAAAELRPIAIASLVLRKRFTVEALHFPDILDVAQCFDLVAAFAHELIGLGAPPRVRRRMLADQTFGLFAILDATGAVLLFEQRFVLARGQIETAHGQRRAFFKR